MPNHKVHLVTEILNVMRKKHRGQQSDEELAYNERDVREVLHALDQAGYVVVARGALNAVKELTRRL